MDNATAAAPDTIGKLGLSGPQVGFAPMSYAGDITPTEAHTMLLEQPQAVLIDVRSKAEWTFVGVPAIAGTRFVEWTSWPDGAPNPYFEAQATEGLDKSQPIVLLCRTGGRSAAAGHVLAAAGFTHVYNVLDGFEGHPDHEGHRTGGWRGAGLPWQQS